MMQLPGRLISDKSGAQIVREGQERWAAYLKAKVQAADAVAEERKRLQELATTETYLALGQAVAQVESESGWVTMATVVEDGGATGALSEQQAAELQTRLASVALRRGWTDRAAAEEYGGREAVKTADRERLLQGYDRPGQPSTYASRFPPR